MQDRSFMRIKDALLIVGTLAGLIGGAWAVIKKPIQFEDRLIRLETLQPKIDDHEHRITVVEEQGKEILRVLRNIDRKT